MDNRISGFLKGLEELLKDLSDSERVNALLYYEEFLKDAFESGENLDEVLEQLGNPQDIADMIKAEDSFSQAQKKPGLRNFNKAMKNAFLGVSSPVGYFIRGLFLLVVYSTLIVFLGGALVSLLGAIIGFSGLLYEMFKIPSEFLAERLGTLGMSLFLLSTFLLLTLGLFRISQWLIRIASQVIRRMLRGKGSKETYESSQQENKKSKDKLIAVVSVGILVIGLILTFASGLPMKLFSIFNSTKPENLKVLVSEYNSGDVSSIIVNTVHSCIKVVNDGSVNDKVVITYEQPDWLIGQAAIDKGKVAFEETSNGRLPLFDLVSLHESRTEVTLYLPNEFIGDVRIESKGGFVSIMDTAQSISAVTYTGEITLNVIESGMPYNLIARTEGGSLELESIYPDAKDYPEITINQQNAARTFNLISVQGNIIVK